ncbi:MAG: cytidylate kinase-like family protein [Anaerolineaceae bacterium]|nr:cytidylate kinase-like family protein [Anaerolineaceae bacterium]
MFSIYTISRQYGSGGSKLAMKLAELSGYKLVWREVINQAAIKIGSPDMALAVIDELGLLGICPDEETCSKFREAISQVVVEIAEKGNVVIVGRASQLILKGFPNCLHLKIIAGMDTRIKNIQLSKNVNEKAAKAQIEESDRNRKNFIIKFYQADWNDPSLYDLTINTDHIDLDSIAEWIIKL